MLLYILYFDFLWLLFCFCFSLEMGPCCSVWWTTWLFYVCYFLSLFLSSLFFHCLPPRSRIHVFNVYRFFDVAGYTHTHSKKNTMTTMLIIAKHNQQTFILIITQEFGVRCERKRRLENKGKRRLSEMHKREPSGKAPHFSLSLSQLQKFSLRIYFSPSLFEYFRKRVVYAMHYTFIPFPVVPEHFCHLPPTINSFHRTLVHTVCYTYKHSRGIVRPPLLRRPPFRSPDSHSESEPSDFRRKVAKSREFLMYFSLHIRFRAIECYRNSNYFWNTHYFYAVAFSFSFQCLRILPLLHSLATFWLTLSASLSLS